MLTSRVLRRGVIALGWAAVIISLGACSQNKGPTVVSTNIEEGATGVPVDTAVIVTFSTAMNPALITTDTFTLMQGSTLISGEVTSTGATATFTPASDLAANTVYTATIMAGVESLKTRTGHISALEDSAAAPKCVDNPGCDARPLLWIAAPLLVAGGAVAAVSGCNPTVSPAVNNALEEDFVLTFTTAAASDGTAPTVSSTFPANGAAGVPLSTNLAAVFSEQMDAATISTTTFTLSQDAASASGTVSYEGITATFNPAGALAPNTLYTATITTGVEDLAGNAMVSNYEWTFTTGETTVQDSIDMGSAAPFAILAGSTVESNGDSIITGDLGVSPGTAVIGFPPGVLNGAEFTGVASAAGEAKLDLSIAFDGAAGRATGAVSLASDLSGLTLYPGLYSNSTSVMLSAGNVTLDALGDENAVFIFQMGSTLTTGSGTEVVLSGGAKAANIYWQVGSSATLGTTSIFKGNILAQESITLETGATLEGRALTQTAAVTLDAAVIAVPGP